MSIMAILRQSPQTALLTAQSDSDSEDEGKPSPPLALDGASYPAAPPVPASQSEGAHDSKESVADGIEEAQASGDEAKDSEDIADGSLATRQKNSNRDLREIAKSHEHLLFHHEFHPYCDGCVRGKTKNAPHYKGAFQGPIEHFGSIITCDISTMADADYIR